MKKYIALMVIPLLFTLQGCAELAGVMQNLPQQPGSQSEVSAGLKQALEFGVNEGVTQLSATDGFFRDQAVRILLPQELQAVDRTLRQIGLSSLADEGLRVLNRAAEDAVVEAKPIFVTAIRNITFNDVMGILMGDRQAATQYLQRVTSQQLVQAFSPKIETSLNRVGANEVWNNIITRYNQVPMVQPVNPDLTQYVTEQAVKGVFVKVGQKEVDIRENLGARTTDLLRRVFGMQDRNR
ncbi:MAG: DUF4197 domain-containing protein [Weeksellaceae bacterium]|nr:DUF4197 domain-containing protein [Weeksellaceae bacterium]